MRHGFVRDALVAVLRESPTPCLREDYYREEDSHDTDGPSLHVFCPTTISLLQRRAHTQFTLARRMYDVKVKVVTVATMETSLPSVLWHCYQFFSLVKKFVTMHVFPMPR